MNKEQTDKWFLDMDLGRFAIKGQIEKVDILLTFY